MSGDTAPVLDAPAAIRPALDALLASRYRTPRDGMLVLLALNVEHGAVIDWTTQRLHNPARDASADLGALYRRLGIPGPRQALGATTGIKRYIDRPNKDWNEVLTWASQPSFDREELLDRIAAHYGTTTEAMLDYSVDNEVLQQARFAARLSPLRLPQPPGPALIATESAAINFTVRDMVRASESAYGIRHVEEAFLYLASEVARTARTLPEMPGLHTPRLTFAAVFALLDELLAQPSRGAYEQFAFAAFLAAWYSQLDADDVTVATKHLNAADVASGAAGDVQVRRGGQVVDAYEITAGTWASKMATAADLLRSDTVKRIHILARDAAKASGDELRAGIEPFAEIAVLDVREELRSLVARLRAHYREVALRRLYKHLADDQLNDRLVHAFVSALRTRDLIV